mgnify:CR=1 FL=1
MITQQRLKQLIRYDRKTGVFTNRVSRSSRARAGGVAGYKNKNGYLAVSLEGKAYYLHRLAWLYVYGYMPEKIDHKNRIHTDNALRNLRPTTPTENAYNCRAHRDNAAGLLGVAPYRNGRWRSQIRAAGVLHYIGVFDTAEQAHCAYMAAKKKLHKLAKN